MAPFVVELPLPPRALSPNNSRQARGPFSASTIARRAYREAVGLMVASAVREQRWSAPARASLDLVFGTKREPRWMSSGRYYPRDADNALSAFKPGLDGLADGGALPGDDYRYVASTTVRVTRSEGPWVRVTVREEHA